ncbi:MULTISPECIES: hypothetical protein [Natrialbaceae]|uniref:hypothetical protein n=1 Tax=Natrialbaceae TaxID=1644061 RepID=UPI00207CCE80|nr:hypothetical protein [Natronococcus sp. CG52]
MRVTFTDDEIGELVGASGGEVVGTVASVDARPLSVPCRSGPSTGGGDRTDQSYREQKSS